MGPPSAVPPSPDASVSTVSDIPLCPWAVAGDVVAISVPCVKCQYDLRTLNTASLCPECGSPVAPSLRSNRLCFAPVSWHRQMQMASYPIVGGIASLTVLPVLGGCAGAVQGHLELGIIITSLAPICFFAGLIWGTWLATPRWIPFEHWPINLGPMYLVPRIAVIVVPAILCITILAAMLGPNWPVLGSIAVILILCSFVAYGIGMVSHMWRMISAVGEVEILALLKRAGWLALLTLILTIVVPILLAAYRDDISETTMLLIVGVPVLGLLSFMTYFSIFSIKYDSILRKARKQAKALAESRSLLNSSSS